MKKLATASILPLCLALGGCPGDSTGGGDGGGNQPGPPAAIVAVSGSGQQGLAGEPLPLPLVVRVNDSRGRAVPNAAVTFAAGAASGSVSLPSATTGTDGQAQVAWTLGPSAGQHTVSASVGSLAPAAFAATATPNGRIEATVTRTDSFLVAQAEAVAALGPQPARAPATARHSLAGPLAGLAQGGERPAPRGDGPAYVPGTLVVTLRRDAIHAPPIGSRALAAAAEAREVAGEIRAALAGHVRDGVRLRDVSPALHAARLEADPSRVEALRAELARAPGVLRVEHEPVAYADAGRTGNDPAYPTQAWHYQMIDLPRAWNRTTGSSSVLVAVLDDGIRFDHPDIAANLTADGYDFVSQADVPLSGCSGRRVDNAGDGNGYDPDPTIPASYNRCQLSSTGGHGLHVAGTIGAAGNNGVGLAGINWSVRIRPVRVLGIEGGGFFDVAQGLLYAAGLPASDGAGGIVQAASAARIINLSLGSPADAQVIRDAVVAATSAGALVVASAGNAGTSAPRYPASYPEVLTVSSVGPDRLLASYSSWGDNVDVAAPGGDFADGNASFGVASLVWDFAAGQPSYAWYNGTSMAAPHVSGAAALLLAHDPALTAAQLRARLLDWALDAGAAGPDARYGAGILNVRNSLTQTWGPSGQLYGRVYDAATGAIVREAPGSGSAFSLGALPDGSYHVFAGLDDEGDGVFGIGAYHWGGLAGPGGGLQALVVQGAGRYPASFSIGYAREREPNDTPAGATRLMLGGSLYGARSGAADFDHYAVSLPAGTYTFETTPWSGACGFAYDADTVLGVYRPDGSLAAENDDADRARLNYCSRLTLTLAAGTYTLRVGGAVTGLYRVLVRLGA